MNIGRQIYMGGVVFKLTYDGTHVMANTVYDIWPVALDVDSVSGFIWVAEATGYLIKLTQSGNAKLWHFGLKDPGHIVCDGTNGIVWISNQLNTQLVRYDTSGIELGVIENFGWISDICKAGLSGGVYVSDSEAKAVMYVFPDGDSIKTVGANFCLPSAISYYHNGGWLYVADSTSLMKVWPDSTVEKAVETEAPIHVLATDQKTGDCWIVVGGQHRNEDSVIKIDSQGNVLVHVQEFTSVTALVANDYNGGCLVLDSGNGSVVRLSSTGLILGTLTGFLGLVDAEINY